MAEHNTASSAGNILEVRSLTAFYGESQVLHGIDFGVGRGEVVTLLGRNGAGKTTILRSIMAIVPRSSGEILFNGRNIRGMAAHKIPRLGVAYVPEERAIFSSLNVIENMLLPPAVAEGGMSVKEIYELFPNLRGREKTQGTKLSGGEQQMLAIARILRTGARFLLLDEPTEGLAPVIIEHIGHAIQRLKELGFTMLLVEQNLQFAASVADRHYVVQEGTIVDVIEKQELSNRQSVLEKYLGV